MKTPYESYKHRSICGEKTDFHGFWITSERFYHIPCGHAYGHDRKPQFNSDIQNVHTLFRKSFSLPDKCIKSARLFITGDDVYKLYVNSQFVGEGPAQSYPFAYNYNSYDVTDLLKSGINVIGVHLYYQGLFNIYLVSADNLCGMTAQLEIEYSDGERENICTDSTWLYTECDAYTPRYTYGYQTQFSEDIDFRRIPHDWLEPNFNAVDWQKSELSALPYPIEYNLYPQITPTVCHERIYPTEIKKIDGGYFFDFGKELTGTLIAMFKGKCGDTVEVRFGEELDSSGRVRYDIRANCTYKDVHTLSGGEDLLDYFDYKGYRYAEILNPTKDFDPASVYTLQRNYPFPKECAAFSSSSDILNSIWKICSHGVRVGTQDTYFDCPTREKGGFVGDALITGLSHLILTGDTRIYKKFIWDAKNASRYCPALMAHLPTYDINICADYSALAPLFLLQYYEYTADKEFIRSSLPIVEGVFAYYSRFINSDGVLYGIEHMKKVPKEMCPILIDWPQNLRDGYDMERGTKGASTTVNVFFIGFLKAAAKLYEIIGNSKRAREFEKIGKEMENGLTRVLYDAKSGLYRDADGSSHSSLHANALQLFFGIEPPNGYAPIVDLIRERGLNCGVYFAYFVIKGLYNIGEYKLAYELLSGDGEHSWQTMLKSGATSCMEAWGPDQKWNTSWCHPWSSSPIYFCTAHIMGIKADAPGMNSILIEPHIPDELDFCDIEIPLPSGMLKASFKRGECGIDYTVTPPSGVKIKAVGSGIDFHINK